VAALGVVTFAFLGSNELPVERPSDTAKTQQVDVVVDSTGAPEDIDLPVVLERTADEAAAAILDVPEEIVVDAAESAEIEAIVEDVEEPLDIAAEEALPAEHMAETSDPALDSEVNTQQAGAPPEAKTPSEVPAPDMPPNEETPAPAPEEAIIEAENVDGVLEADLEAIDDPAIATLEVEISETPPAPDPIQPALAIVDPALGVAPEIGTGPASTLAAEAQPLLGESSPPLSLAQVLPPGEAPAPDQIAPSFDLVRVSPDGSALIAGRAAPGAFVQVFSGTIPVAEATASARGEFVVFLNAPSDTTLDLQIPAAPEGAALVVSQEDIVILPAAPDAADATPIVVHRTPDAVHILQPAAPAVPLNVSLDLVSYADSGAVQLAGRGQPGNVARIYADGVLAGESQITQGGTWALEVSDIAEGRYVLRVDEITPAGEVFSRTESPFQRQFPEAQMPDSFSQGAKIIVQPGNTLWLMATEAYGDGDAFLQIFSANKDAIRDPDLIYPGQIFSIPRIEE